MSRSGLLVAGTKRQIKRNLDKTRMFWCTIGMISEKDRSAIVELAGGHGVISQEVAEEFRLKYLFGGIKRGSQLIIIFIALSLNYPCAGSSYDWPMWRYDANRSAASPMQLPSNLYLQWIRNYPKLKPAWPDQPKMLFGSIYEPVIMGKTMFVGSSLSDKLVAIDTDTGNEKWVFYAEGPIHFAPVAWQDKVYFASDDGYLYCIDSKKGSLIWKFLGGPSDKRVIGNNRLTSMWPARGSPVLTDGRIYFAASIWPFMGIFVHALDAETGRVRWTNSSTGPMYMTQPHRSPSFAGVVPQGYIAAVGDKLIIPTGRALPAVFNRLTGEYLYFNLGGSGSLGDYRTAGIKDYFISCGVMFDSETGGRVKSVPTECGLAMTDDALYGTDYSGKIQAYDLKNSRLEVVSTRKKDLKSEKIWEYSASKVSLHIKSGSRLYAVGNGGVEVIDIPIGRGKPKLSGEYKTDSTPVRMLTADNKLFVVTSGGSIYCFGKNKINPKNHTIKKQKIISNDKWTEHVKKILKKTGENEGYCIVLGIGTGRLIEELVVQSKLYVIAVDPDEKKVGKIQKKLDDAGLYGTRAVAYCKASLSDELPPYLANLIVSEDLESAGFNKEGEFINKIFHILRPYGGTACLQVPKKDQAAFMENVKSVKLSNAKTAKSDEFVLLTRAGALPDSADWTHQYADIGKTCVSKDKLVRAPLGLLWFGGPSNEGMSTRHGNAPSEQVIGGRMFIQGVNIMRAVDVYTGRIIWEKSFPNIGKVFGAWGGLKPGASGFGSNYVSVHDGIYVMYRNYCFRLDPATGKEISKFKIPGRPEGPGKSWGYIEVCDDFLIVTSYPVEFEKKFKSIKSSYRGRKMDFSSLDESHSKKIIVMNRNSGKVIWKYDAKNCFRHNTITIGADKLFCIDKLPDSVIKLMEKEDQTPDKTAKLIALDLRKGRVVWNKTKDVFGTWLGYSKEHDILLQAGRKTRLSFEDEIENRMSAYKGKNGKLLWENNDIIYGGPGILYKDTIITQGKNSEGGGKAYSLLTGELKTRKHPITDEDITWKFSRDYGCSIAIASEHLLTFRSGAAAYYDLKNDGGTGNMGGFRAGCTATLIAANGVLNAPDFTRTCVCSYQNQASLALIHMPEAEMWTFNKFGLGEGSVKRVGINFGAPGDRMTDNGTLWLDYPSIGGPSPDIKIKVIPEKPEWFCYHSSRVEGKGPKWVAASGAEGITDISIPLLKGSGVSKSYRIKLYFVEFGRRNYKKRIFDITIQNKTVLRNFNIYKEAGERKRIVVKEFKGVKVKGDLNINLTPSESSREVPIICGIEIIAEGW